MDVRSIGTISLAWLTVGCATHTQSVPVVTTAVASAANPIKESLVSLQVVPAGVTIEATFTPTTPFVDSDDCYRWPSHCVAGLKGGVYLYHPGEVLFYQYMPVGDYTMKVEVVSLGSAQKHEQTSRVHLGADIEQVNVALGNGSQAIITLRGEATQRYDARICEGGSSGGSLNSSSAHRIVCSVADGTGVTWSMEGSSPRELYEYLPMQICKAGDVMMRHSQYAATFACQPADPSAPMQPGVLVVKPATP